MVSGAAVKDLFVSYANPDQPWAEWVAWQLEELGFSVVVQAWDFSGNWVLQMNAAMQEADRTVALLSPDYLRSKFTPSEWAEAFRRDPTGERGLLIPVRVAMVEPTGLLAQLVYVDLVGVEEPQAILRLRQRVHGERRKPASSPPYPGAARRTAPPSYPGHGVGELQEAARAVNGLVERTALPSGLVRLGVNPQGFAQFRHEQSQLVLVLLPGGSFTMGSAEGTAPEDTDEHPAHEVVVSPFLIAKFPVTQQRVGVVRGRLPPRVLREA